MPSRFSPSAAVVIPAYNAAGTIARTLDSVIAAADACAGVGLAIEIDIAVVDDFSTDNTAAIVEQCSTKDRRVRLIRAAENGGPGKARNLGVAGTTGALIFFLDADDVFYPNHIHLCSKALIEDDSIGYVFTRLHIDMPIHADWKESLDESNPINFCVRRIWHDMIGGYAEHPDFRTYRTEDTLYRMCLRRLVKHRKLDVETCEQFVSPGNALDRQRSKLTVAKAEWMRLGHDDGFRMTPAMEHIALEKLAHVQKLRGG